MIINYLENERTIEFAAFELKRYLEQITGSDVKVCGISHKEYANAGESIRLGLHDEFSAGDYIAGNNSIEDDSILIDINNATGIIAGSNPGSVLIGVYRYLKELGCRFIRPGRLGEYIPNIGDVSDIRVYVNEKASYRHRGICIEGANTCQNVIDMIDWAPKTGFNSYFFQFRESYTFYERWYSHKNNKFLQQEPFSITDAKQYMQAGIEEIKKRGMRFHAVGHGWTCEPFGIKGDEWESKEHDVSPEISKYLAKINGKREIYKGVALNTNLCYSNPKVRNIINSDILEYLKDDPLIDYLHFWLADGTNNHCECDDCIKAHPSDYYVMMLNELNEMLTKEQIDTKIVFLIYVDLLWTPLYERIKNQDRFVMMFAPITRSYSKAFTASGKSCDMSEYKRNELNFPKTPEENIMYLNCWREMFAKDSFDFDYHFMWDHYMDPGYMAVPKVLYEDIRNLEQIGLNGYISCQTQRAFFPTGLGMYIMGGTLWDKEIDYDKTVDDYFRSAYGEGFLDARDYLTKISEFFDPDYLRDPESYSSDEAISRLSKVRGLVSTFMPVVNANSQTIIPCHRESWEILKYHAHICEELSTALIARARGDFSLALEAWMSIKEYVQKSEERLQPYLDVWLFIHVFEGRLFKK